MQVNIQYMDGLGEINMLKNYEEMQFMLSSSTETVPPSYRNWQRIGNPAVAAVEIY